MRDAMRDADATRLHADGCLPLSERPDWALCDFAEHMKAEWHDFIVDWLEKRRAEWFGGDGGMHGADRPGARVAELLSRELRAHGIFISATHASIDDDTWAQSGPRFYASIIRAARAPGGCCDASGRAPRPPPALERTLWPDAAEAAAPHVTELGWTLVPPNSPPQEVHADISGAYAGDGMERKATGRFHHIAWKPAATGGTPTTEVVAGAFTEGEVVDEDYAALYQPAVECGAPCLIIDSECLHRGAAYNGGGAWGATCTVQLSSTSGWPALHSGGRCCAELRELTFPIVPAAPPQEATPPPQATPPPKEALKRRAPADGVDGLAGRLRRRGFAELPDGLPAAWRDWALIGFVEEKHAAWADAVVEELAALRELWPAAYEGARPGERAAAAATQRLRQRGIDVDVYTPQPSQADAPPFLETGPRFYVSLTAAARAHFGAGGVPAMPAALRSALWPADAAERDGVHRARGIGWTLAPPHSDPQTLHADLWATPPAEGGAAAPRFVHVLWKRGDDACTTEFVPGGFTRGDVDDDHYGRVARADGARALVGNGEVLHRGAATGGAWASTLSIELCSPAGWRAWERGTGGTYAAVDDPEYAMLVLEGE